MLKIYCYSRCSTCKKAVEWLENRKIEHEIIDIKENPPSKDDIRKYYLLSKLPLKKFWNTSGVLYREMALSKKLPNMSEDEQIDLLSSDGMLLKRPLLIGEDFVLIGFKENEWEEKLIF